MLPTPPWAPVYRWQPWESFDVLHAQVMLFLFKYSGSSLSVYLTHHESQTHVWATHKGSLRCDQKRILVESRKTCEAQSGGCMQKSYWISPKDFITCREFNNRAQDEICNYRATNNPDCHRTR